jgi:hypothetical protein
MRLDPEQLKVLRGEGFRRTYTSHDVVIYTKTEGQRKLEVQFWADSGHRASHFLNGHMTTLPTSFCGTYSMLKAIRRERTRKDHPRQ